MGAIRKPSRQSLGTSRAKVRLRARTAEKAKAIHSSPPESSAACYRLGSSVNLHNPMTSRAKTTEELKTSLVRNSARRSFLKMANAAAQNLNATLLSRSLPFSGSILFHRELGRNANDLSRISNLSKSDECRVAVISFGVDGVSPGSFTDSGWAVWVEVPGSHTPRRCSRSAGKRFLHDSFSKCPPNPYRIADSSLSAKSASPRELNRW